MSRTTTTTIMTRTRAVLYVRYSTPGQKMGDSDRRQHAAAENYAAQNNLCLDIRTDDGLSAFDGTNLTRGQLGLFARDLEAGILTPGTKLIVEDLSRFSRQETWRAMAVLARIMEAGGALHDISDGQVYDRDNMDVLRTLTFVLRQGAGHEESRQKSRRVSATWDRKKREDTKDKIPLTRQTPYGLRVVGEIKNERRRTEGCRYEVVESEAAAVRHAWSLAADGYSEHAITKAMNDSNFLPPRGRTWARSTIARFLREDRYAGVYQPHKGTNKKGKKRTKDGPPILDLYPRIIDEKTINDARAKMAERSTGRVVTHATGKGNLFTGIGFCRCGCNLMPVDKNSKRSPGKSGKIKMICRAMKEGHVVNGNRVHETYKGVVRDDLEAAVLLELRDHLDVDGLLASRGEDVSAVAARAETLRSRLGDEEKRYKDMVRGLFGIPEGQTKSEMIAMVDEERTEVERLKSLLAEAEADRELAFARRLDAVEVVREVDQLIDWVTGGGSPLVISGEVGEDVLEAIAQTDAKLDRDRARVKLKALLREVVERLDVNLYEETFILRLKDGQVVTASIREPLGIRGLDDIPDEIVAEMEDRRRFEKRGPGLFASNGVIFSLL